jgi:hypothetical protein
MSGISTWAVIGAIGGAILLAELARVGLMRLWRRAVARRRQRRALAGERRAERLLERRGFSILERQPQRLFQLELDGAPLSVELRADLLVARRGRLYVAEVKTGSRAPRIETSATRRQLLEYRVAYAETEGVLLVDAEAGSVREVVFPIPALRRRSSFGSLTIGVMLGAAITWVLLTMLAG